MSTSLFGRQDQVRDEQDDQTDETSHIERFSCAKAVLKLSGYRKSVRGQGKQQTMSLPGVSGAQNLPARKPSNPNFDTS